VSKKALYKCDVLLLLFLVRVNTGLVYQVKRSIAKALHALRKTTYFAQA